MAVGDICKTNIATNTVAVAYSFCRFVVRDMSLEDILSGGSGVRILGAIMSAGGTDLYRFAASGKLHYQFGGATGGQDFCWGAAAPSPLRTTPGYSCSFLVHSCCATAVRCFCVSVTSKLRQN